MALHRPVRLLWGVAAYMGIRNQTLQTLDSGQSQFWLNISTNLQLLRIRKCLSLQRKVFLKVTQMRKLGHNFRLNVNGLQYKFQGAKQPLL